MPEYPNEIVESLIGRAGDIAQSYARSYAKH